VQGKLATYDWLHLHHEDFTGQYGKFYRTYSAFPWYRENQRRMEELAAELGFAKVSQMKLQVVKKIREFVGGGGFMFAMCSATDTYDIALNFSNMILSFNNGKIDEWNKQITNLIDISGVQKEDKLYWKQLNIFKRACSVAFDNNSSYSKKLLGDSLQPLNFSISVDDKLKSLPSTNRECPKCTEAELKILKNYDSKSIQEKQTSALEQEKRRSLMNGKENDIDLNKPELTDDEYDTECNKVYDDETDIIDKSMDKMKLFIQLWIFIILSLMFGFVIYVILSLFWDKIAYIFNSIVLRSTQFIYYLVNSFNKYFKKITDKEEEKEQYQKYFLTKIQRDNVTAKLDADMRRYNIKANNG
jgi:hypothetical protein